MREFLLFMRLNGKNSPMDYKFFLLRFKIFDCALVLKNSLMT